MKWRKYIRRILLYPLLVVSGCHLLTTGSPIPLWHIESLNNPVPVTSVTGAHLILEDGCEVHLPYIVQLPKDNLLFQQAISDGIEIDDNGEIVGLIWFDRFCFRDAVWWRKMRVNLSGLAGALNPDGIDTSVISSKEIARLKEKLSIDLTQPKRSHSKCRLTLWDYTCMQTLRKAFERSTTQLEQKK